MNKLTELANQILADAEKTTKVVAWYAHSNGDNFYTDATVRGPYHRWFRVEQVPIDCINKVAPACDDAKFAATAMNSVEILAKAVLIQQEALKKIQSIDVETNESLQADCSIIASQCFTKVNAMMGEK